MAEQYKKPYLESSVFIAWIKGEAIPLTDASGKVVGCEERGNIGKHILSLAETGQFQVYTSSITIAEVHKSSTNVPPANESTTIDFFRNGFFKVIDVDRTIAESAHRLCRKHGLKPYDAVHLACAVRAGCDALLTWDSDLLRIADGGITIAKPQALGQSVLDLTTPTSESVPIVVSAVADSPSNGRPHSAEKQLPLEAAIKDESVVAEIEGEAAAASVDAAKGSETVEATTNTDRPAQINSTADPQSAAEGVTPAAAPDIKCSESGTSVQTESSQ